MSTGKRWIWGPVTGSRYNKWHQESYYIAAPRKKPEVWMNFNTRSWPIYSPANNSDRSQRNYAIHKNHKLAQRRLKESIKRKIAANRKKALFILNLRKQYYARTNTKPLYPIKK